MGLSRTIIHLLGGVLLLSACRVGFERDRAPGAEGSPDRRRADAVTLDHHLSDASPDSMSPDLVGDVPTALDPDGGVDRVRQDRSGADHLTPVDAWDDRSRSDRVRPEGLPDRRPQQDAASDVTDPPDVPARSDGAGDRVSSDRISNRPPSIDQLLYTGVHFIDEFMVSAVVSDPDLDPLLCRATIDPPSAEVEVEPDGWIDDCSWTVREDGAIRGTPITVVLELSDQRGGLDSAELPLTVGNHPPVVTDFTFADEPFTGASSATVYFVEPDGDHMAGCSFEEREDLVVFQVPVLEDGQCSVDFEEGDLRRGTEVQILVRLVDEVGGGAVDRASVWVGNHAPTVEAGASLALYPGELRTAVGIAGDIDLPDSIVRVTWSLIDPPAGVLLYGEDTLAAQISVDRSVYEAGPDEVPVVLTLEAEDDLGALGTDSTEVWVLDERGPYVSNLSPYSGTGPRGYCGVMLHPCNNLADALTNTFEANEDGAGWNPMIVVATTGVDYRLEETLLLDHGVGVSCGYTLPDFNLGEPYARTPLIFQPELGVHVRSAVTIERCAIVGSFAHEVADLRVAVSLETRADLQDCVLVANPPAADPVNHTVDLLLDLSVDVNPTIRDTFMGPSQAVLSSVGLEVAHGQPEIRNSMINGGQAQTTTGILADFSGAGVMPAAVLETCAVSGGIASWTATGIEVLGGNLVARGNNTISGGEAPGQITGVKHADSAGLVRILDSRIHGNQGAAEASLAVGVVSGGRLELAGNIIRGGHGDNSVGLQVEQTARVDVDGDTITGGTSSSEEPESGFVTGIAIAGGSLEMHGADIAGTRAGDNARVARGLHLEEIDAVGELRVDGSRIGNHSAEEATYGILLEGQLNSILFTYATITSGHVYAATGSAHGAWVASDGATFLDSHIIAGIAPDRSVGLTGSGARDLYIARCSIRGDKTASATACHLDETENAVIIASALLGASPTFDPIETATGLHLAGQCMGCRIDSNTIEGAAGPAIHACGLQTDLPTPHGREQTIVANNVIRGGAESSFVSGVVASGDPQGDLLLLHNLIDGSTTHDVMLSCAVEMGRELVTDEDQVGIFAGNILLGKIGFLESCEAGRVAHPTRAVNSNFAPTPGLVLLSLRREDAGLCAPATMVSSIEVVNVTDPYHMDVVGASYLLEPGIGADGHLEPGSPMRGLADVTFDYWDEGSLGPLGDLDGERRPAPAMTFPDIGPDEIP